MTDNETLRELFPHKESKDNYILVPVDKYEEIKDLKERVEKLEMAYLRDHTHFGKEEQ